ncbi:MAG: ATP-binding cassette domain-containing protein [Novosphingobium sp.]
MSESPAVTSARDQFGAYLAALFALGRARIALIATLVAAGSLVEGVGIVLLVPLVGLVFAAADSAGPLGRWAGSALDGLPRETQLLALVGVFAVLLAVRAVVVWQRDLRLAALSIELVDAWRARLVRAVAGASWRRLQELRHSRLEFAVTSEVGRLALGSDRLLRGAVAALQLAIQIALALVLSPQLTLIALAVVALGAPLLWPLLAAARRHGEDLSADGLERQDTFSEFLAGMKLAKASDAEARYAAAHNAVSATMRARVMAFLDAQLRGHNGFQLAAGLAAAVLLVVGLTVIETPPAVLSALLVLLARIAGPAQQLAMGAQSVMTMLPAVGSLTALEAELREGAPPPAEARAEAAATGHAAIAFRGLTYHAPGRADAVLRGVDGEIGAGELAALFGASGAGKTTLADIVLGLVEADGGELLFDGSRIASPTDRAMLRRQVGYVPQEPFLFDQTIRENLAWAAPEAGEDAIWRALAAAEADIFVRALPQGLDAAVGNRGTRLSGGERQRICLARALIRQPRLLILDEATSALDREVEARLWRTLARLRGSVTLLAIAHRLPDGLPLDRRFELADGRLRET